MTLNEICRMIAEVEEGLMYGEISFSYDNMMCAFKPGHPADILDDILSIIGWDVFSEKTPSKENIERTLDELKNFKKAFKVKELNKPIKELKSYLEGLKDE